MSEIQKVIEDRIKHLKYLSRLTTTGYLYSTIKTNTTPQVNYFKLSISLGQLLRVKDNNLLTSLDKLLDKPCFEPLNEMDGRMSRWVFLQMLITIYDQLPISLMVLKLDQKVGKLVGIDIEYIGLLKKQISQI